MRELSSAFHFTQRNTYMIRPVRPELNSRQTTSSLLQLLLAPLSAYHSNVLTFLSFPSSATQTIDLDERADRCLGGNYTDLLNLQPFSSRRQIAHAAASALLRANTQNGYSVETVDGADAILGEFCSVMVREQHDGGLFGPSKEAPTAPNRLRGEEVPLDWEDVVEEQNLLARFCHLLKRKDGDPDLELEVQGSA
jgi:vacuolar protein sorting-associated protein 35